MRTDDPWYDALASGWGNDDPPSAAATATTSLPRRVRPRAGAGESGRSRDGGEPRGPRSREAPAVEARAREAQAREAPARDGQAAVYLAVQRSDAFQQVRRRYRRFVLPGSVAFLAWYLAYVVAATAAPGLMARPVAGVFNIAMAAGLAQFASTFLLTWAYVRHARLRRDELALELRWETQDLARTRAGAPAPRTAWESMP
jgi:uncharacterized membrane protein (DUF485 family)